jgi:acetyl esterase/lipase
VPSLASRALVAYLLLTRRKRPFRDPRVLDRRIEEERRTLRHEPPAKLATKVDVERTTVLGVPVYTLRPKTRAAGAKRRRVVYLHGGCYVYEIVKEHWWFCASIAQRVGCAVTVPIYPLAPEHEVGAVLAMVREAYRQAATSADEMAVMGDSAGGGMALALAQLLRDEEPALAQPAEIVLLSPWLDVAMTNPEIAEVDRIDPWLAAPGLAHAGRLYAGDADPKSDPRVSPLHGDLSRLGRISVVIGTRDVLLPDTRALVARARSAGTRVRAFEHAGMVHDFMLVPFLPEAKVAKATIATLLSGGDP